MTGALAGTTQLVRLVLRRDRVRLPVWVVGLTLLTYFSGDAMGTTFPTQASMDAYADSLSTSPAAVALSGPPIALDTLAGIVLNKVSFIGIVGVSLMAVFEVVRHSRAEEEEGRVELVRAASVGRDAPGAAAILVTWLASVAVGLGVGIATDAAGVPFSDAMLYGASVALLGVFFATATLCLAQLFTHARATSGAALALFGIAYVVRGIGDVQENALVWLSPVGWSQATHPLGDARWWPLLVSLAAAGALAALARVLQSHRDVGTGMLAARAGHEEAPRSLSGPVGLALRLQRANLFGWVIGVFVLGLVYGSLTKSVDDLAKSNETLEEYFRASGPGSLPDAFLSTMLLVLALLAGAYAASSALRLTSEEAAGRLEPLLATSLTRSRWMLGSLAVTLLGSAAVLLAGGFGLGASYAIAVSDGGELWRIAGLQMVYLPAVLLLGALAALAHGWAPAAAKVVWAVLAVWFVVGYLGALIDPPEWLRQLSPYTHTPEVPLESLTLGAPVLMALLVAGLTAVGVVGFRTRDVH